MIDCTITVEGRIAHATKQDADLAMQAMREDPNTTAQTYMNRHFRALNIIHRGRLSCLTTEAAYWTAREIERTMTETWPTIAVRLVTIAVEAER